MKYLLKLSVASAIIWLFLSWLAVTNAQELDARTTLVVCAAAHIVADDAEGALWYATIAEDEVQIEFFTNLFIRGLESKEITNDDVADTIEACAKIKVMVETPKL